MKYVLLIGAEEEVGAAHALDGCDGWTEEMQARGVLAGGAGLRPPADATTLRVRDGKTLLSDGPYADTKEQIGGFVMIDCADLDEAIEIASKHPAAGYGLIEIRPLWQP
jgi:hypothetical protein